MSANLPSGRRPLAEKLELKSDEGISIALSFTDSHLKGRARRGMPSGSSTSSRTVWLQRLRRMFHVCRHEGNVAFRNPWPWKGKEGGRLGSRTNTDDHVGVSANASRIRQINLKDPENFMASENVFSLAQENGWWKPESGQPFEFCYAYADRNGHVCPAKEWRVLSKAAPTLEVGSELGELSLLREGGKETLVNESARNVR